MTFLYTARCKFDKTYDNDVVSWDEYIEWSKLTHLTELVSFDVTLNEILVDTYYEDAEDWDYIHVIEQNLTGFFTSLDFVLKRLNKKEKFNLLMVVLEPDQECIKIDVDGFEFVGYDLLDKGFYMSALTNCGGFDETFLPTDLNDKGLIDGLEKAYDIKKRLLENNPCEYHADTNVIAVWRHRTIGR